MGNTTPGAAVVTPTLSRELLSPKNLELHSRHFVKALGGSFVIFPRVQWEQHLKLRQAEPMRGMVNSYRLELSDGVAVVTEIDDEDVAEITLYCNLPENFTEALNDLSGYAILQVLHFKRTMPATGPASLGNEQNTADQNIPCDSEGDVPQLPPAMTDPMDEAAIAPGGFLVSFWRRLLGRHFYSDQRHQEHDDREEGIIQSPDQNVDELVSASPAVDSPLLEEEGGQPSVKITDEVKSAKKAKRHAMQPAEVVAQRRARQSLEAVQEDAQGLESTRKRATRRGVTRGNRAASTRRRIKQLLDAEICAEDKLDDSAAFCVEIESPLIAQMDKFRDEVESGISSDIVSPSESCDAQTPDRLKAWGMYDMGDDDEPPEETPPMATAYQRASPNVRTWKKRSARSGQRGTNTATRRNKAPG